MPQYGLVLYVDVQLLMALTNFVLDYLLLWATATLARAESDWKRLSCAALLGTLYYVLYTLAFWRLIPFYGLLRQPPIILLVSLLMLAVAFAPVTRRRFWSITANFVGVTCLAGGSGIAAAQLLGGSANPNFVAGLAVAASVSLLIAEIGWTVIQRRAWEQDLRIPLDISFGSVTTRVMALLDTGNHLNCPLSGAPVVVVEHQAIASAFPPELAPVLESLKAGDLSEVHHLLHSPAWSTRFRIIPFTSLGTSDGLMVGFRPTRLTLWLSGKAHTAPDCVVALAHRPLDPNGIYQALISPVLIEGWDDTAHLSMPADRMGLRREEDTHVVTHG